MIAKKPDEFGDRKDKLMPVVVYVEKKCVRVAKGPIHSQPTGTNQRLNERPPSENAGRAASKREEPPLFPSLLGIALSPWRSIVEYCRMLSNHTEALYTPPDVDDYSDDHLDGTGDDRESGAEDTPGGTKLITWRKAPQWRKVWLVLGAGKMTTGEWVVPAGVSDADTISGYRVIDRWGIYFADMTPEFRYYYVYGSVKSLLCVCILFFLSTLPTLQAPAVFIIEAGWVFTCINCVPCRSIEDSRTDIFVNLFKLGIYGMGVLASSGFIDPAVASGIAMILGMSALGYSILGFVIRDLGLGLHVVFWGCPERF